jgi:hypothetical protein
MCHPKIRQRCNVLAQDCGRDNLTAGRGVARCRRSGLDDPAADGGDGIIDEADAGGAPQRRWRNSSWARSWAAISLSIMTAVPQQAQLKKVFCCTHSTVFTVSLPQCGQVSGISLIIG